MAFVQEPIGYIDGIDVYLNDTFRSGTVVVEHPPKLIMNSETFQAVTRDVRVGGSSAMVGELQSAIQSMRTKMQTTMVDLSRTGRRVRTPVKPVLPSNDRVDKVCEGIRELTSQMAFQIAHGATDGQVSKAAKRYAELAKEMKLLREAMVAAEGNFEIAQQQVMALMGEA